MSSSYLEEALLDQLYEAGLPEPETELRFHPTRLWRFDLAWPEYGIACEVEGGYLRSRHRSKVGYAKDCVKYAEATLLGWKVYRFTSEQVLDGTAIDFLERAFLPY